MTSYPGQPTAPKKTLTWLAIASFVLGLVLTAFFVWRIVETVPQSPRSIENGSVHLDEEGLKIYSSEPVLPPECEAKDANGSDVPLERPNGSETITVNGETWYLVGQSVDPVPAGDYVVSCTDDETAATYAAGPRTSVVSFVVSILGAIGSFLLFFILGTILLVVGAVKRRRAARPGNTFPTYPPPGGPGYPPPGGGPGYPPPGGPGYPPPGPGGPGNTTPNDPPNTGPADGDDPGAGYDPRYPVKPPTDS